VDPTDSQQGEVVPEHFLALLYGFTALLLGGAVWSAMPPLFGVLSLLAAPGLGWLIGWASRHGGRVTDTFIRTLAWLMALAAALLSLLISLAFMVTQTSPDAGFQLRDVGVEYVRLFTEPPWFGSLAVILTLAGTWRALNDRPTRRKAAGAAVGPQTRLSPAAPTPAAAPGPGELPTSPSPLTARAGGRAFAATPVAARPSADAGSSAQASARPDPATGPAAPQGPGSRAA
jgi:hypothetical protein